MRIVIEATPEEFEAMFNVVGIIALVFVVAAALRLLWALLKWQSPDTACLVQQSLGLICN